MKISNLNSFLIALGCIFLGSACTLAQSPPTGNPNSVAEDEHDHKHEHGDGHDHGDHSHGQSSSAAGDRTPEYVEVPQETPAFKEATDKFRNHLRQMLEIEIRFHNSDEPEEEKRYRQQWYDLREQAFDLHRAMLHAGLAEYLSAPQDKPKHAEFLFTSLKRNVESDCFEGMLPIARGLYENGYSSTQTPMLYALCCLAENEYDQARKPLGGLLQSESAAPELLDIFNQLEDLEANWQQELESRQADAKGEPLPQAKIVTTKGVVVIEMFENDAPEAVANFVWLAEQGFYNHKSFFLVLDNLVAQTGCPTNDGTGGPGYFVPAETIDKKKRHVFRGSIALKLLPDLPDSGGSQFLFSYLPLADLEAECTVFGRVISGMPNLAKLSRIDPKAKKKDDEPPVEVDEIISVEILRKRNHAYEPTRLKQPFRGDSPPGNPESINANSQIGSPSID
jgi:cyclophilin family peptidyl-prolyl cis-trans isomerase